MKKLSIFAVVLMVAGIMATAADSGDREVNVFAGLGTAVSDLRGLTIDMGAEVQLSENMFGQILFDYYMDPSKEEVAGVDDSAYGINFYGVYKMPISERLNCFIKAGAHYTTLKATASSSGYSVSVRNSDFGICGGGGVEYRITHRVAVYGCGTIKFIFADGDAGNWFKLYGGISYRVK